MNKTVGIIIKIVLLGAVATLGYFIIVGINKPISFENYKTKRFNMTIDRLKDIRTAQIAFKEVYGYYTPDFDTLINFIKNGKMRTIYAEGFVPDSLTELQAVKLGIVIRDTSYNTTVKDSLFKHIKYPIDSIRFLPSGKLTQFKMDTASVFTMSGVTVKVFQCYGLNKDILDGLDKQLIINHNAIKKDTCIRVGSLTEANNNAGNWE